MAILTYEELFNFTKEFSKAFEALLSSNMRDWSTVNSVTIRGNNNDIVISCYFRTIEYTDSSNSLKDLKDFISNKLIDVGRIKFHFDRNEIEISGNNGSIYKRKNGKYELHSPRSNEKRIVASERVEKYFDLLENLILSSKKAFILEKSKSELEGTGFSGLDRDRFYSDKTLSHGRRYSAADRDRLYKEMETVGDRRVILDSLSQANNFHVIKNRTTGRLETTQRYMFEDMASAFAVASESTGSREPTTTATQIVYPQSMESIRPHIRVNPETDAERYRRLQNLFRRLPSSD